MDKRDLTATFLYNKMAEPAMGVLLTIVQILNGIEK